MGNCHDSFGLLCQNTITSEWLIINGNLFLGIRRLRSLKKAMAALMSDEGRLPDS